MSILYKLANRSLKNIIKKSRESQFNAPQIRLVNELRFEDIPEVSPTIIRNRLKKFNVSFEEAHCNFVVGCCVCEKNGESLLDKTKIFINKRTGSFTCESCKHTGSWTTMFEYITAAHAKKKIHRDPVVVKELEKLGQYLRATKKNTTHFSDVTDEVYEELKHKFGIPAHIDKSVLEGLDVRINIQQSHLYFPLYNSANDLVGYKLYNPKSSTIEPKLPNTLSAGVLLSKPARYKCPVVVSNVIDFLLLVQTAVPFTIICLPNGLVNLSLHVLPCFEKYSKLYLWLGNDLNSWDVARKYARKLGEKKCYVVRTKDNIALANTDPEDFKAVIQAAQPIWHKSIITFAQLREDVLSDLKNVDRVQGIKWSRYPGLNRILKGHRLGELTVFTGPTGSGKTTFISEYSLDLAMQGVNTLWGSFEIRNARLAKTMLQQMSGLSLEENLDKYDYYADQFEQLPIYYMTFHGQQSIKVVLEAIEHAIYVHDISHVIIDNLQFMMGVSEDTRNMDRFWKQDVIVSNFRTLATRRNCHVTLVIHPRKERDDEDLTASSIFGGAKASQEADNILIIQDKRLLSVKGKKYLQICKNRYSGDLGIIPLDFDKSSLSFAPKKKSHDKKSSEPKTGTPEVIFKAPENVNAVSSETAGS